MTKLLTIILFFYCSTLIAQNKSNNWTISLNDSVVRQMPWIDSLTVLWKRMFPAGQPPLQLWSDSGYIVNNADPDKGYISLKKINGEPEEGFIYFYDTYLKFTFFLKEFKSGEKSTIKLHKIYKLLSGKNCNYTAVLTEFVDKKSIPIAIIYFK
jgi:hypothetical protein